MLLEEKCLYNSDKPNDITPPQRKMFQILHKNCKKDPNYKGFHCVTFSNTNPLDSDTIWWDGKKINKIELIIKLKLN